VVYRGGMEKPSEKLSAIAPGRLPALLAMGLRGHHPLFEPGAIREAFAAGVADSAPAGEVEPVLLAICRDPPEVARDAVESMPPRARTSLIRLYFRLLDRAAVEDRDDAAVH
jgi:hypothetical protein